MASWSPGVIVWMIRRPDEPWSACAVWLWNNIHVFAGIDDRCNYRHRYLTLVVFPVSRLVLGCLRADELREGRQPVTHFPVNLTVDDS